MHEHFRERLLSALFAAERLSEADLDPQAAWAELDEYVERELAGEEVATRMPRVAFFIATDPQLARAYRDLRATLLALEATGLPTTPFELEPFAAQLGQTISIAPEDVVFPPKAQFVPPKLAQELPLALINAWERTLTRYSRTHMSGQAQSAEAFSAPLPAVSAETRLEFVLNQSGDLTDLDGRVRPDHADLVGQPIRLYAITLEPEPVVRVVAEQTIDRFGRFAFADLPAEHYVVALIINQAIIGAAWLDLD
ncbi:MAG: hypothetical protein WCP31_02640 [Chloroflexales bacterium]